MWFFATLSLLTTVFVLYVYFLSASVMQVVMRKEVNQEIASLSSRVSELESEYIDAQHKVSADFASHDGFVKTDEKIFIDRTKTTLVLSEDNES
jgi:cell division protein FtsL